MTTYISTLDAKEEFSELINRVVHKKERVVLLRRGKEIAAIVPLEDFHLLQKSQSATDLDEAVESLKEARTEGTITLQDLKEEIG
jgi:prevent-host-death family protein